ncbi:MAG: HAMP domain-containing protein [Deltaproteobacteria bacterium]|nr:HAMP domain-containing protein [Deltaproteobacteria bacterium]
MRLGTKLTLGLSLIIIFVLSGYGFFHVISRREILIRKMKVEVMGISQTLKISLEKISPLREREYVQYLINSIEKYEKTLGVIVYHPHKDFLVWSQSLEMRIEPFLELINRSIKEDNPQEEFGGYKKTSIFSYAFPLKDKRGKNIGGVAILQKTTFVEEEIRQAKWTIFITILVLIGGTVVLIFFITRKWITLPIFQLMDGIKQMAKGQLNTRIDMKKGDEISELAQAFNQMAVDLRNAQEKMIQEMEIKLELERNLRQSEKLATIGQLASELAHEFGTPLNIISGRADLMKRRLENKEETQKNLDVILLQTGRITKIIQQLLGFVRKKKPERRPLEISLLLETTLDFIDHQIQKQKVKVAKDIKENLPLVTGDSDQLQQVFLNILLNAVQSMPQGGTLRLSASPKWISKAGLEAAQRQYVEVFVEDTGVGIEKEVMENIFQPFFTTKEKEKGTGLGLTLSQGIVQDHEGWIEVESEIGKGSVFKIYLPASQRVG